MTVVGYPDISVDSTNGNFRAEARSPDNGAINQRNGDPPDLGSFGYRYGQEQRSFRYQLIDKRTSRVVWERWQQTEEGSPHELSVSDNGWVVIRTHGYTFAALIVVSPLGEDCLHVAVCSQLPGGDASVDGEGCSTIKDDNIRESTAGLLWTRGATNYFFQQGDRTHFAYVTGWGRRIVLDLDQRRVVDTANGNSDVRHACEATERVLAREYLRNAVDQLEDYDGNQLFGDPKGAEPFWRRLPSIEGQLGAVIRNRVVETLPILRAMEPVAVQQGYGGCNALPDRHWVFRYSIRPLTNLAIRCLGEEPEGYSSYGFFRREFRSRRDREGTVHVLEVPECKSGRDALLPVIRRSMCSRDVLDLLGAPDYLEPFAVRRDPIFVWGEHWDYYQGTSDDLAVMRVTWEPGSEGARISEIETVAMTQERIQERIYDVIRF
ncbi:MAG: hypothetical protein KDB14_09145 [Planctomycetales bacterium]|nr:hypothetical protein [Planctomycetales bacterium]